ncbi:MAG TPA: ABC transporter permease [Vicinamibacterales bacterium]|nr:ABC transporter permease [Vicinamibacterales bacterium]
MRARLAATLESVDEAARLALDSMRLQPVRSLLAIAGVVVGIVTVVVVASVLANVRNQVALLFRELGTDNIFAFHLSGDPYSPASESEAGRRPLKTEYAAALERLGPDIRDVGVEIILPAIINDRPVIVRAGASESDTALLEGASANYFDIVGAAFSRGRPFTPLEDREGARVAILGASLARALFGSASGLGRPVVVSGETYTVVGELARRRGGFFGENRQDSVISIPAGAAERRFGVPDRVVLYIRAKPGRRAEAFSETETILRRLRRLDANAPDDFHLSTADQIIGTLDRLGASVGLVTVAFALVSLFIGGIGIANVMIISVTERTREIGLRMALGAQRRRVLLQFLLEAAFLSGLGGLAGVALSLLIGFAMRAFISEFSAVAPLWAIVTGLAASVSVGVVAGYWPARRAARLDPVDALRHE